MKVYSSGSALQGGPKVYLQSAAEHTPVANFAEIASFKPFDEASGVSVATTSTTIGADLLVSGVSPADKSVQVLKFQLVRPDRRRCHARRQAAQHGRLGSRLVCHSCSAAIEPSVSDEPSTLLLCARILPGREAEFAQWQVRWQTRGARSPAR